MFPLLIHDWIHSLEGVGYRPIYGENVWKEPTVFFAHALPGDIVNTLRLTHRIFDRNELTMPELSRSVLTAIGVVYVDYRIEKGTPGTRITVPIGLSAEVQENNKKRYDALVKSS